MKIKFYLTYILLTNALCMSLFGSLSERPAGYGPQPFVDIVNALSREEGSNLKLVSPPFRYISTAETNKINPYLNGISFNVLEVAKNSWLFIGDIELRGTSLPVVFLIASPEKGFVKRYYKSGQYFSFLLDGENGYLYLSVSETSEVGKWKVDFAIVTDSMFRYRSGLEKRFRNDGEILVDDTPLFISWLIEEY